MQVPTIYQHIVGKIQNNQQNKIKKNKHILKTELSVNNILLNFW